VGADEITDDLGADLVYGGKGADNLIGYGGAGSETSSILRRFSLALGMGICTCIRTTSGFP
jgi:hypothetical protein